MATVDMLVGQKVTLAIVPTVSNADADLTGTPSWVSADATVASVNPAADGRTCEVTAKKVGSAVVTATAQGITSLNANHTINVTASNLATAIVLTIQQPPQ